MNILNLNHAKTVAELLLEGKVGVLPTDTIYGLHCLASDANALARIYELKKRPSEMPYICLIRSVEDLQLFDIPLTENYIAATESYWPGPNTLIFTTQGGVTRSFRVPNNEFLQSVLTQTGPLVSTSANIHGQVHSPDVQGCIDSFGEGVDFYVDGGVLANPPSCIYKIDGDEVTKVR